jgi:hypothetical protein
MATDTSTVYPTLTLAERIIAERIMEGYGSRHSMTNAMESQLDDELTNAFYRYYKSWAGARRRASEIKRFQVSHYSLSSHSLKFMPSNIRSIDIDASTFSYTIGGKAYVGIGDDCERFSIHSGERYVLPTVDE